jgi:hypothetical protein
MGPVCQNASPSLSIVRLFLRLPGRSLRQPPLVHQTRPCSADRACPAQPSGAPASVPPFLPLCIRNWRPFPLLPAPSPAALSRCHHLENAEASGTINGPYRPFRSSPQRSLSSSRLYLNRCRASMAQFPGLAPRVSSILLDARRPRHRQPRRSSVRRRRGGRRSPAFPRRGPTSPSPSSACQPFLLASTSLAVPPQPLLK